eukprot:m.475710 g.475710  ORF g.475710 m.475710 type:complete len:433 (+) comp38942_c0_seq1:285-1583(+)
MDVLGLLEQLADEDPEWILPPEFGADIVLTEAETAANAAQGCFPNAANTREGDAAWRPNVVLQQCVPNATRVTAVHFPRAVHSVGTHAFDGAVQLRQVHWHSLPSPNSRPTSSAALHALIRRLDEYEPGLFAMVKRFVPPYYWAAGSIGPCAFRDCSALTVATLGFGVATIGEASFAGTSQLAEIELPPSVKHIGRAAFASSGLTRLVLPSGISRIPESGFRDCTQLAEVTLPNSVFFVGDQGFAGCLALAEIALPPSLAVVGASAFADCGALVAITIPPSVIQVSPHAFDGCELLTEVTLPGSICTLEPYTFARCTSLARVDIVGSWALTRVGHHAFRGCSALSKLDLPPTVTAIERYAFAGCGFAEFSLPGSVKSLGDGAFRGCPNLVEIEVEAQAEGLVIDAVLKGCLLWRGCRVRPTTDVGGNSASGK